MRRANQPQHTNFNEEHSPHVSRKDLRVHMEKRGIKAFPLPTQRYREEPREVDLLYNIPSKAWGLFSKQQMTGGQPEVEFGDNIYSDKNELINFLRFPASKQRVRVVVVAGRQNTPDQVSGNFKATYLAGPWTVFQFTSSVNVDSFLKTNPQIRKLLVPTTQDSLRKMVNQLAQRFGGKVTPGPATITQKRGYKKKLRKPETPQNEEKIVVPEPAIPLMPALPVYPLHALAIQPTSIVAPIHEAIISNPNFESIYQQLVTEKHFQAADYFTREYGHYAKVHARQHKKE